MSFPVESFWKLVVESQLLSLEECHHYHGSWAAQFPGGDAQHLAEWLLSQNVISRYQASILLAGRAGPFVYGDYKIYDRIESGRLKGVFRALHIPTMHTVCLQFLTAEQAASPENVARLTQQAALVSRTSAGFPHLLRCYHLVDLGAYKFFVLEDLQGKRIERILTQKGALPQSEACRVARQAALGLARLHGMQQAHGDVRPANIWVDASGTVKLLQFPLSRDPLAPPVDWRRLLSSADAKVPPEADFVAPELISGAQPDARSDIYELGCSLYMMLTNKPPFPMKGLREKLEGHLKQQPIPIEQLNPAVAPALAKVVMYMMAKKSDMRYQQAATVIEKILPFMTAADAQSQPTPPTRASQMYDAWLQERLAGGSAGQSQAAAQPQAAPQPMQQPMPQQAGSPYVPAAPAYAAAAPMPMQQSPMQQAPMQPAPMQPAPFSPPGGGAAPQPVGAPAGPRVGGPAIAARPQRRSSSVPLIAGIAIVLGLIGVGAFMFKDKLFSGSSANVVKQPTAAPTGTKHAAGPGGTKPTATATAVATAAPAAPKGTIIAMRDTMTALGEPVWESPTAGKPLALNYLTRGVSMVVAYRPSELIKHPEFDRLLDEAVLGPVGAWVKTTLPSYAGTSNDNIEQVIVGFLDGNDGVRASCVIHLKAAADEAALVASWGNPTPEDVEGGKIYVGGGLAFHVPSTAAGKVIVVAPKEDLVDSLSMKGAAPPLSRRELDFMVQNASDGDRQFTVIFTPQYLSSGGQHLIAGTVSKGLEPMNWLFTGMGLGPMPGGEGMTPPPAAAADAEPPKAVLFSAQLADGGGTEQLFWELRLYHGTANAQMENGVAALAARVQEIPQRIKTYVLQSSLSMFSREILLQMPNMVKFLAAQTRAAVADRQLLLRGYAPDVAAHNLAMGAYLCMIESPGAAAITVVQKNNGPAPTGKQTALDILRTKKITMAFERNDLNKVLAMVSEELGVPIEMVNKDFQDAGITRNQGMGLAEPEQTADKLLMVILKKANPDGQLVYFSKPSPEGVDTIYIGTRKGTTERKDPVPPEFAQAPAKK